MRKNYLGWFVLLTFLLLGCRNEDFVNQSANTKREEEFFREALSKTARIKNGNSIVAALKRQNEKSHFVSKMKDQSGLPIWDRVITIKNSKVANKGENDAVAEEYMIPLTENDKDLSSILFVTKSSDSSYAFKNMDNEGLKAIVYDPSIEKNLRQQLLASFIFVDYLSFSGDAVYWNLPDDLFSFIPESTLYPQRRFKVNIRDTPDTGTGSEPQTNELYYYQSYVLCAWTEIECTRCPNGGHSTYENDCVVVGGGGGGGMPNGGGDTGGHGTPGDNGGGGGGGRNEGGSGDDEEDDCNLDNKPFYKIVPGCDDDDDGSGEHGGMIDACAKIKTSTNDSKYKSNITTLQVKTGDSFESGFRLGSPVAGSGQTSTQNQILQNKPGTREVDMKIFSNTFALMHSHYDGLFPMFSPGDILLFNQWIVWANSWNAVATNTPKIPLNNLTLTLVTTDGNYLLAFDGASMAALPAYTPEQFDVINKDL